MRAVLYACTTRHVRQCPNAMFSAPKRAGSVRMLLNARGRMSRDSVPSADEVKERIFQELSSFEQLEAALTVRSDSKESVVKPGGSAEWTNALLNIVLRIGADCGFEVYPRRKYFARHSRGTNSDYDKPLKRDDDRGEWLVDAAWTRYPAPNAWVERLRSGMRSDGRGLVLACESEWASGQFGVQDPITHVSLVLDDFAKLVDVRAPLKLMFFGFQPGMPGGIAGFDDIVSLCGTVAAPVDPTEHYLLFGWPYFAT